MSHNVQDANVRAYRFPLKCIACGLHYNVYSWHDDWTARFDSFCPECGKKGVSLLLGREDLTTEIFNHVGAVMSDWQREQIALLNTLDKEAKA